jgi:hypothetical protein
MNQLMLFAEKIAVYFKNCVKLKNILCGQTAELCNVKTAGMYIYHHALHH